jgi:hypothetical protein
MIGVIITIPIPRDVSYMIECLANKFKAKTPLDDAMIKLSNGSDASSVAGRDS